MPETQRGTHVPSTEPDRSEAPFWAEWAAERRHDHYIFRAEAVASDGQGVLLPEAAPGTSGPGPATTVVAALRAHGFTELSARVAAVHLDDGTLAGPERTTAQLSMIVLPGFATTGLPARMRRMSSSEAVARLLAAASASSREQVPGFEWIAQIVHHTPCFELLFTDLERGIELLLGEFRRTTRKRR